jgi:hypothetical protein
MLAEACRSLASAFVKCPRGLYCEIKYDGVCACVCVRMCVCVRVRGYVGGWVWLCVEPAW